MADDETTLDTKLLEALVRTLNATPREVRVGILGNTNARKGGAGSNAEIGAKHEFGEVVELNGHQYKLPVRSFLRMPLTLKLHEYMAKNPRFTEDGLKQVLHDENLDMWFQQLGIMAEAIVLEAFQTRGFGQWKPSNMKFKTVKQTLVETQQLRNSITSEVV